MARAARPEGAGVAALPSIMSRAEALLWPPASRRSLRRLVLWAGLPLLGSRALRRTRYRTIEPWPVIVPPLRAAATADGKDERQYA